MQAESDYGKETLSALYGKRNSEREHYLNRARRASELTIPGLYPKRGTTGATLLKEPWQSLGARGINGLAAKIVQAIFPENVPFFKKSVDELARKTLAATAAEQEEIDAGLAQYERVLTERLQSSNLRAKLNDCAKQLIVGGNALLHVVDEANFRVFKLSDYVVERDPVGNVLTIVVKEKISRRALPPELHEASDDKDTESDATAVVDVYTGIFLEEEKERYCIYQEVLGKEVPGSRGHYPLDRMPWLALRFYVVDGEHYGRGYVDEYIGDLAALEGLSKAIVQGAAASSKLVWLVKPGSVTNKAALKRALNGDFVDGDVQDVQALQVQKQSDFGVAQQQIRDISERLGMAFLLNSSIQRTGERVTAEEIRYMAQSLENELGGIYSLLSQELQLPLVKAVEFQMQRKKLLPMLPKNVIRTTITTGVEALGRGQDVDRLRMFVMDLVQLGPQAMQSLNIDNLISRLAVARGINVDGLVKSAAQLQQEQMAAQQAQQEQLMQQQMMQSTGAIAEKAIPEMIAGAGEGAMLPPEPQ